MVILRHIRDRVAVVAQHLAFAFFPLIAFGAVGVVVSLASGYGDAFVISLIIALGGFLSVGWTLRLREFAEPHRGEDYWEDKAPFWGIIAFPICILFAGLAQYRYMASETIETSMFGLAPRYSWVEVIEPSSQWQIHAFLCLLAAVAFWLSVEFGASKMRQARLAAH